MTVKMMLEKNIPAKPNRWSVRLPAMSISQTEMSVITTMIDPTPSVAYSASRPLNPAFVKMPVE